MLIEAGGCLIVLLCCVVLYVLCCGRKLMRLFFYVVFYLSVKRLNYFHGATTIVLRASETRAEPFNGYRTFDALISMNLSFNIRHHKHYMIDS